MNIGNTIKHAQDLVKHNSPVILTGIAAVGTISTALLAAQAGWKAYKAIDLEEIRQGHPITGPVRLSNKERVKIAGPLFIPVVGVGTLTIACVLGANHIQGQRAAALAGAYSLSEKAFTEYRAKVIEKTSASKEQGVRDAIAQDQITRNPPSTDLKEIMLMESTESICYESWSGRYFTTTVEKIRKAQNDFNATLLHDMSGSLNDFWDLIGLTGTTIGEELGWTSEIMLEVHITTTMDPNGRPCLSLGYVNPPVANYWKFR